jgi:polysaccharide biosynthesis/export protein
VCTSETNGAKRLCTSSFMWARRIAICSLAAAALAIPSPARSDYRLDTGDVLEISVFGVADFKRRFMVNADGELSVPFLDEVQAAGLSLAALRRKLTQGLAESGALRDPDVTIELVECRPFSIGGDVARPGSLPYRPGLTVRIAIAMAGGYDAVKSRIENPLFMVPDLLSQQRSLWIDLVKHQARLVSLKAEREGKAQFDLSSFKVTAVPDQVIAEISELEARDLALRLEDFNHQTRSFERALQSVDETIKLLNIAFNQSTENLARQKAENEWASGNLRKGPYSAGTCARGGAGGRTGRNRAN